MERPGTTACLEVAAEDVQFMVIHPDTSMLCNVDIDIDIDLLNMLIPIVICYHIYINYKDLFSHM